MNRRAAHASRPIRFSGRAGSSSWWDFTISRRIALNTATCQPPPPMTEGRFAQVYDELQRADCTCEMSAFLSVLPDHELKTVFEVFLDQYGQELAAGALEIRLVVWNADNQDRKSTRLNSSHL